MKHRRWKRGAALPLLLALIAWVLSPLSAVAAYTPPDTVTITASSAMLVYLEAGASGLEAAQNGRDTILYEKNADAPMSPAAMVRVAVGLYAAKWIRDHGINMQTETGTYTDALEENHIWGTGLTLANMEIGETWTVEDLLSLSMIQTAADACVTLAQALCGSVDAFVVGMNQYAKELGCQNTTFTNVHGLDDPRQRTTARDLYLLMRAALDYPELERMMSRPEYTVHPVNGGEERSWENSNYMLRGSSDYYYEPMTLGKTGVSEESGRGLVSVAEDSGYRYMAIVLGCPEEDANGDPGTHYQNTRALYRWAFGNFTYKTLITKNQPVDRLPLTLAWDTDSITLVAKDNLSCLVANELDESTIRTVIVPYEESVEAPVEKGTVLGRAELYIQMDEKIGEVELVASESIPQSRLLAFWKHIHDFFTSPWFWITVGLLLLLIVGYAALTLAHNRDKRRRRRSGHKYKPLK